MGRKLFTVTIQTEILVLADDETHAAKLAKHIVEDEWSLRELDGSFFDFKTQPMDHLPIGCTLDGYPEDDTLEEPEHTIGELIELGAAPGYKAAITKVTARQS